MKRVTAWLVVYAILVIASSIFWMWYALSKSSLTAGRTTGNVSVVAGSDKTKQDAELVNEITTKQPGGVTEDAKASG
jgi:cytoskeletal protein RodZ